MEPSIHTENIGGRPPLLFSDNKAISPRFTDSTEEIISPYPCRTTLLSSFQLKDTNRFPFFLLPEDFPIDPHLGFVRDKRYEFPTLALYL